jgi:hypothetical protein
MVSIDDAVGHASNIGIRITDYVCEVRHLPAELLFPFYEQYQE